MPGVSDAGTWDGANQSGLNSGGGSPVHGTDPDTGITGIKFDEGFEEGETRYYYFIVDGNYAQDSSVVIASKGGNDYDTATITGPSPYCEIYVPPSTQIDVEKYINGEDADVAPGVELVEGDEVTFSFEVNNTGSVDLTNVIVGDDKLGIICQIALLKAGETVACMKTSVAIAEQYTNLGKAATYYGGPPKAGGVLVRDTDRGNYFGQYPPAVAGTANPGRPLPPFFVILYRDGPSDLPTIPARICPPGCAGQRRQRAQHRRGARHDPGRRNADAA